MTNYNTYNNNNMNITNNCYTNYNNIRFNNNQNMYSFFL